MNRTGTPPSRQASRPSTRRGELPPNVYRRGADPQLRSSPMNKFHSSSPGRTEGVRGRNDLDKTHNENYEAGLNKKYRQGVAVLEAAQLTSVSRVLPPVKSPHALEYRSLFKLAVRPKRQRARGAATPELPWGVEDRFAIGLFEPGSHRVLDMDDCPLHVPALKRLLKDLRLELNNSSLTPYDEETGLGQVRYIVARAAHLTGEIMLTFVVTEPLRMELKRLVTELRYKEHKINSAHMNINTTSGNAIFGEETFRLAGNERLRERVCDLDLEIGPTSFFQINPWQAVNLYRRIEQIAGLAAPGEAAWDLYCGTGQIALILARAGYQVLGIEEVEGAVGDAEMNAYKNNLTENASFMAARVEDVQHSFPKWARSPSLIVVNPSRRGLAESTRLHLRRLLEESPRTRFLYVSCDVETLARDLKDLAQSGFQIRQIEPFDMFPHTDHMEWLAVMSR